MSKLKTSLYSLCIILASVIAYADDDHHFFSGGGGGGSSGPLEADAFIASMAVVGVAFLFTGGLLVAAQTLLFSSLAVLKARVFLHFLSPVVWVLFAVALIPAVVCYDGVYFAILGIENDPYAYLLLVIFLFLSSILWFYLFNLLAGLFSPKPFGKYMMMALLIIAILSLFVGLIIGSVLLFLPILFCALACWLATKLYRALRSRGERKLESEQNKEVFGRNFDN